MKFKFNADPEYRFFDFFPSVIPYKGWTYPGYILNLYWVRVEIAKFWEAS